MSNIKTSRIKKLYENADYHAFLFPLDWAFSVFFCYYSLQILITMLVTEQLLPIQGQLPRAHIYVEMRPADAVLGFQ